MRPRMPRPATFAVVLAFALSGCGFFQVDDGVAAKGVQVNLVFGAASESPEPSIDDPGALVPSLPPPLELPPPVLPQPFPRVTEDLCPPTTAKGAKDPVVTSMQPRHAPPAEGYLVAYDAELEGEQSESGVSHRIIKQVELEASPYSPSTERLGFQYFVEDAHTGVEMQFLFYPGADDETPNEGGIYLKSLQIPTKDGTEKLAFITARFPHLQLAAFPIQEGEELTAESADIAPKRRSLEHPLGGEDIEVPEGVVVPSPNTMSARTVIGEIDNKVLACADLGAAFKVSLDLRIAGDFTHRIIGTFWLAPQYGGWPIKDEYIMFGDLLSGVFGNELMRLPPSPED